MAATGPAAAAAALAVAHCVADIEVADLVAFDMEFSGLFLSPERDRRPLTLDEYFSKCVESIPQFLPLQLGICCARQKPQQAHANGSGVAPEWEFRAHEFNLWPQDRRIFCSDLQSLRFLRAHGFDFNSFFDHAHAYARLPPAGELSAAAAAVRRLPPSHAARVLEALRSARAPLVVHNGLLDLLHVYDKFLGDLPQKWGEFGEAWLAHFPLLFDTRLIAQEGRFQVLKHTGGLSLEELHKHLTSIASPQGLRFERTGPLLEGCSAAKEGGRSAHGSAAVDATLTAEVFLLEMDLWIRSSEGSSSSSARKRRKKAAAAATAAAAAGGAGNDGEKEEEDFGGWTVVMGSGRKRARAGGPDANGDGEEVHGGLSAASLLESHDVCRRFHNRIAVVGASPGFIDLGRPPGPIMPQPAPPP